jgi:cation transporter-like permease
MTDIADWVLTWRLAATRRFVEQSQPALLAWTMFPLAVIVPVLFLSLGRIADFAGSRLASGLLVGAVAMALTCVIGWLGTG